MASFIITFMLAMLLSKIILSWTSSEFRIYTFSEVFDEEADDTCTQTISMYDDLIFGGKFVYDVVRRKELCKLYTLEIYANYPDNVDALRIMFRVENTGSGENTSINLNLHVSDGSQMNKSLEICYNCKQTFRTYVTSEEVLKITFPFEIMDSWTLSFTAFHTGLCRSYEYMCANKRCIFHSLSCIGFDPCGDQSDCLISPAAYAAIALGGFCTLGVLVLITYMFIKSKKSSDWSSRGRQPRKFSPAKALQSVQSFTPATVSITPIQRRWSYKY